MLWARAGLRRVLSGSLCALLARFHVLTLPGVRFVPVWLSTGRTVRLAWVRWLLWCGCDGPVWCFVASCVRIGGRPGRECGRGARSF